MNKAKKIISLLLTIVMITVFAAACNNDSNSSGKDDETASPNPTASPTASIPKDEYTLEKEAGHNQLTLYWTYPGSYENCDIWMWWDGKEGSGHLFHECEYGAKVVVKGKCYSYEKNGEFINISLVAGETVEITNFKEAFICK